MKHSIMTTVYLIVIFLARSTLCVNSDEAVKISQAIIKFAKEATNYHKMTEDFKKILDAGQLKISPINGAEIVKGFKKDLEDTFSNKSAALRKIAAKVEEEKKNYVPKKEIKEMMYLNMLEDNITDSLQIEESFSPTLPVNLNNSTVQVPTPIYANSTSTLNDVMWTQRIDTVFRENFHESNRESNGSMSFQYYGDRSGLFRVYPGMKLGYTHVNMTEEEMNEEKAKADFFDARRRGWFLLAASSPKDVVIIVDVSGSMSGTKIGIARITAMSLIDTLTENDFFNVIAIKQDVRYMRPCTRHLIQATTYNKVKMKEALKNMGPVKNITNATKGMSEAFYILNSGAMYNRTSGGCNQMIMFISDGIEEKTIARDVFEKENSNKSVRVFTFHIGHIDNKLKKRSMINTACSNRGFYYHIETLGSVWDTVLQYTQVISRPMGLNKNNSATIFSPIYKDAATKGMVMSLSMGVFDKEGVIGVVGTDISADNLLEKIPFHKMSSFARVFVIDNNGFVILHPNYETQPDRYRNIFLENFERGVDADVIIEAKKKMINRVENGQSNFPTYITFDDEDDKVVEVDNEIFFEPIKDTEFSSAVVIPKQGKWDVEYVKGNEDLIDLGINALNSTSGQNVSHSVAKWQYCSGRSDRKYGGAFPYFYSAKELFDLLQKYKNDKKAFPSQCNEALVKKLLLTAGVADKHVGESWMTPAAKKSKSLFVTTAGGYHKIKSSTDSLDPSHKVIAFENVAGNPKDVITISVPPADSEESQKLAKLMSSVRVGKENVLVAVSGAMMNYEQLHQLINDQIDQDSNNWKFLIDRNGYIVFSNRGNADVGKFIGELSAPFAQHLEEKEVLKKVELEGLPTECSTDDKACVASSGNLLLTPLKILTTGFFALVNAVSWISLQYTLLLTTSPLQTDAASKDDEPNTFSCTKVKTYFIVQEDKLSSAPLRFNCSKIDCAQIRFEMKRVDDTNLFYVKFFTAAPVCQKDCRKGVKLIEVEKMENGTEPQRYRRVPGTCSKEPVEGEDTRAMCGRGSNLVPSLWLLFILVMIWMGSC